MTALPEKLQSMKNDLAKMETLLTKEREGLASTEKFKRELDLSLKMDEGNIAKAKTKLQQVKTGKDYMAAQREIEATRKAMGEREEEILKLLEAIENTKKNIAAHEGDVAQLAEHVRAEEATTSKLVAELEAKAVVEREARKIVVVKVKPDVMKRYGSIRMRRGLAVVPVIGGTCQGCHMTIPPQLYNTLQRGTTIEACPSCHRIVYWDEIMKDKDLERGEDKAATPPAE